MTARALTSTTDLADALRGENYLADEGLATVAYLAYTMRRPLFLEGDPGVGKTEFAKALAEVTGTPLVRLQCYEGIDRRQALYDWNFPKQMLHLRAAEDSTVAEGTLWSDAYLIRRPILQALEDGSTLLIDEIDRADDEFEAFLLEVLADHTITIPELGAITATEGNVPLVVITSNRTRDVHDALKRRCFYHWMSHPEFDREVDIVRRRVPAAAETLIRDAATLTARMRDAGLQKPPGIAETIDWVDALRLLGHATATPDAVAGTLGIVLKYQEDIHRVRSSGLLDGP